MRLVRERLAACAAVGCLLAMVGCASPGPLRPPSLRLPAMVKDLTAQREGDVVRLRFTAPTSDTDKLALKGTMTAELCRQSGAGPCIAVAKQTVAAKREPQEIAMQDALPGTLTAGAAVLVTYRVQVLNDQGKSAGSSEPAYTAGGAAPERMSELRVAASEQGAVLRWRAGAGPVDAVEVKRIHVETGGAKPGNPDNPFKPAAEPREETLRVDVQESDPGGTVDATAQFGQSYTYTVERIRRLTPAGHTVEIRSASSAEVRLEMRDTFPPQTPRGLTAAQGSDGGIDLSWEANTEADLAGYFVFRAIVGDAAAAVRLTPAAVAAPAFRDATARAGVRYRYSVSAVDQSGNESGRSAETEEGIQ